MKNRTKETVLFNFSVYIGMSSTCKLLDLDRDEATLSTCDGASHYSSYSLDEEVASDCLETFKKCSAIIGFLVGLFIQGSTLGLTFMIASLEDGSPSATHYVNVTVMWSIFASFLAVAVLYFMRSLVISAFYSTNDPDSYFIELKEVFMHKVIRNLEKFYAIGALGGVGAAWCITDVALDVKSHLLHSICTFGVAAMWYFSSS